MLLDKDDDLQHHLRRETNADYVAASVTTIQRIYPIYCTAANYYKQYSVFCLTPSVQAAEYASATLQRMQPDLCHLIQGYRYRTKKELLCDVDDLQSCNMLTEMQRMGLVAL